MVANHISRDMMRLRIKLARISDEVSLPIAGREELNRPIWCFQRRLGDSHSGL